MSFNEVYWTELAQNLPDLEDMVKRSPINDLGIFDKQQSIQAMRQHAIGIGDALAVVAGSIVHELRSLGSINSDQ